MRWGGGGGERKKSRQFFSSPPRLLKRSNISVVLNLNMAKRVNIYDLNMENKYVHNCCFVHQANFHSVMTKLK